ncbi:SGNH/GDSL hydrolase family protein [bacterium]|nr:SGNH/GDSL hydrolase family protein [bacterium]
MNYKLLILTISYSFATLAHACPSIGSYPDINCDGQLKVLAIGDSITYGLKDQKNDGKGGYPLRFQTYYYKKSARINIINYGIPGITCEGLYERLRRQWNLENGGLRDADYAIVACGVNAYFTHRDPDKTVDSARDVARFLRSQGIYVSLANLPSIQRSSQREYVDQVNARLDGVTVRFDKIASSKEYSDGLHPNSKGYDKLFKVVQDAFRNDYRRNAVAFAGLTDLDRDGVYDQFETSRFNTNPALNDTDGDGLGDSRELFKYGSNPLVADTDGDGLTDAQETAHVNSPVDPFALN